MKKYYYVCKNCYSSSTDFNKVKHLNNCFHKLEEIIHVPLKKDNFYKLKKYPQKDRCLEKNKNIILLVTEKDWNRLDSEGFKKHTYTKNINEICMFCRNANTYIVKSQEPSNKSAFRVKHKKAKI